VEELESCLVELHPYDQAELIAVPIESGNEGYLNWVRSITNK